jgi:hypothetical protein
MRTKITKKLLWLAFYSLPLIAYAANFTEPRVTAVAPQPPNFSGPVKVIIYKSHLVEGAMMPNGSTGSGKPPLARSSAQAVKAYILNRAMAYGVSPSLALWIVKHESSFDPRAKGDGEASRGLWQISRIYHPEVSDAEAFSVASSTDWSLQRIRAGKVNEWSSYRHCKALYADCPF